MWLQESEEPTRIYNQAKPDSLIDGLIVPAGQALFTGVFSGLSAFAGCALLGVPVDSFMAGEAVFSFAVLASWLTYRAHWAYRLERLLGIDLPALPSAPPSPNPVRVELVKDGGRSVDFIDLPYSERLPRLAGDLLTGRQFSQDSCAYILSRKEFNNLRDEMIKRGLATWRNESAKGQGVELTSAGRAILRKFSTFAPALPENE